MQKHFATLLVIASAVGFAMPAFAAPSIVSKTELKIPVINQTILNRFYKLIYPEKAAVSNKPFNVGFQEELPCGDTTYRLWVVGKNLKVPFVYFPHQGSATGIGIAYQAVRKTASKWATGIGNSGSGIPTFLGCDGQNVIVYDPWKGSQEATFGNFETPAAWEQVKLADSNEQIVQADGITQQPGYLYMANQCTGGVCTNKQPWGSSAILVFKDGKMQKMEPPHYRDFSDPSINLGNFQDAFLRADFYRLSDGYLVVESVGRNVLDPVQHIFVESNSDPKLNVYRIHDGESTYTKIVDSVDANAELALPVRIQHKESPLYDPNGLVIVNSRDDLFPNAEPYLSYSDKVLIHGFKYGEGYVGQIKFLWQTPDEYVVRYLINIKGRLSYWQVIVKE